MTAEKIKRRRQHEVTSTVIGVTYRYTPKKHIYAEGKSIPFTNQRVSCAVGFTYHFGTKIETESSAFGVSFLSEPRGVMRGDGFAKLCRTVSAPMLTNHDADLIWRETESTLLNRKQKFPDLDTKSPSHSTDSVLEDIEETEADKSFMANSLRKKSAEFSSVNFKLAIFRPKPMPDIHDDVGDKDWNV